MLKDFNLNKKDYYYLAIVTIFSIALTCNYIIFNYNFGIYCSDVYVYLLNAIYYSTGENIRSTGTIYLSPLVCFLTSIFQIGPCRQACDIYSDRSNRNFRKHRVLHTA